MSRALIIAGTDTDVGKTVVAAGLVRCIPDALYWKPVQAGLDPASDTQRAKLLSGLPDQHFLPEAYSLDTPASPHLAARIDGVVIDPDRLALPQASAPLIVESAGGVMVPLTDTLLNIDMFARWGKPVILVARTALGTINHSLLTVSALRARDIPMGGIIFVGDAHEENETIIPRLSGVRSLGRLPHLDSLDPSSLHCAMQAHIDIEAIGALVQ
ncbi:MAG: dethiobiotin synthase [Sphingobium sp.]